MYTDTELCFFLLENQNVFMSAAGHIVVERWPEDNNYRSVFTGPVRHTMPPAEDLKDEFPPAEV